MTKKNKKNTKPLAVEELKNREKLLFFIHSLKFKKVEENFAPISAELKKLTLKGSDILEDRPVRLRDKMAEATENLRQVLRENNLPHHFSKSLFNYLVKDGVILPMRQNFTIRINPPVKLSWGGHKVLSYADEVQLVTYAPLSTKEMHVAQRLLKKYWKICFPLNISKRTNLRNKDVDKKFAIEQAMMNRRRKVEYAEDPYLTGTRKQYGENVYKKTKRSNLNMVAIKAKKNTSKDVARKFYGTKTKAGAVRTLFSRMKKRRNTS
jgi:hypothetical protein